MKHGKIRAFSLASFMFTPPQWSPAVKTGKAIGKPNSMARAQKP